MIANINPNKTSLPFPDAKSLLKALELALTTLWSSDAEHSAPLAQSAVFLVSLAKYCFSQETAPLKPLLRGWLSGPFIPEALRLTVCRELVSLPRFGLDLWPLVAQYALILSPPSSVMTRGTT